MTVVEREALDREGALCWSCDDAIVFEDSGVCIDCKYD